MKNCRSGQLCRSGRVTISPSCIPIRCGALQIVNNTFTKQSFSDAGVHAVSIRQKWAPTFPLFAVLLAALNGPDTWHLQSRKTILGRGLQMIKSRKHFFTARIPFSCFQWLCNWGLPEGHFWPPQHPHSPWGQFRRHRGVAMTLWVA